MAGDRKLDSRKLKLAVDAGAPTYIETITSADSAKATSSALTAGGLYMVQPVDGGGYVMLDTAAAAGTPSTEGVLVTTAERLKFCLDDVRTKVLFSGTTGTVSLRIFKLD
jgi:hypothetical protein